MLNFGLRIIKDEFLSRDFMIRFFGNIYVFLSEGFRGMTIGKTLWAIVLIKLFIMFVLLKIFFFPDFLKSRFPDDKARSAYVIDQMTNLKK